LKRCSYSVAAYEERLRHFALHITYDNENEDNYEIQEQPRQQNNINSTRKEYFKKNVNIPLTFHHSYQKVIKCLYNVLLWFFGHKIDITIKLK